MSYLPCKNPACKSHGRPHPNCKCWGGMAAGGSVEPYCSKNQAHKSDCEYFADGGGVEGTDEEPPGFDDGAAEGTNEEPPGYQEAYDGSGTNEEPPVEETSLGDKLLSGYQGGLRGLVGPLADTVIKENPLIFGSLDSAHQRETENPGIAGTAKAATVIGSLVTGVGQAGAMAKASEIATGSKILQQMIQGGLLQASDEVSKWVTGQGDPEDATGAATSIGAASLFSGLMGAAGQTVSKGASAGLKKLADAKMGERALSFLRGLGFAAKTQDTALREMDSVLAQRSGDVIPSAYNAGAKFFDKLFVPGATATGFAVHGYNQDGLLGAAKGAVEGAIIGTVGKKAGLQLGKRVVSPAALWILKSGNVKGFAEAMDHAETLAKGSKIINGTIDNIFKSAPGASQQIIDSYGSKKIRNDLDNFIGAGGMTDTIQQELYKLNDEPAPGFADGGEVTPQQQPKPISGQKPLLRDDDGVALHYPEQNTLLSAARGRVSNYLMGLRPQQNMPKLPFDDEPDTRQQKKKYEKALTIAISPLSVMHEIKRGTIEPDHIKHLNSMYPELTSLLQKKITEQVVKAQLSGKKPPYKVRQGLSMLLGAPLSAEMTPSSIQAAQRVFTQGVEQPPTQPTPQQSKGGDKSKLSKSDQSFLTGSQARQRRSQREN